MKGRKYKLKEDTVKRITIKGDKEGLMTLR